MSLFTPFAQGGSGSVDVIDSTMVSFKGLIEQGKRTGQGVMKFSCGTIYDGGHENDKFHGQATITLPNGETYEAEYKEGWLLSDRMSTYTFCDGSVLKGYPAGNTMYDRIVCLPNILRERRSKYTIQTEAQRAAGAQAEEEQEDADYEYWRFRKEMETPYDKAERERVCRKNAEPEDEDEDDEDEDDEDEDDEDEESSVSAPTKCIECDKVLTPDYFVCGVCNKDYCCTKLCSDRHWASHPCNVEDDEE